MKTFALIAMTGALTLGGAAWAETPTGISLDQLQAADHAARAQVLAALEDEAPLPAQAPTLPDQASDRARFVHQNIAFGQKGAAQKAAHANADHAAKDAAKHLAAAAANKSAQGAAASAARSANADSHAAAGQSRADEARSHNNGHHNGSGNGNGGNGNLSGHPQLEFIR